MKTLFNEDVFDEFLQNHDPVYTRAPAEWERGAPMANSLISAMAWGDSCLKVTLARGDIWEMRRFHPDPDQFHWSCFTKRLEENQGRAKNLKGIVQTAEDFGPVPQNLPIGRFEVRLKGHEILDYKMRLHLYDAFTSGRITTESGGINWKCHVSAKHPLIIFNYRVIGDEEPSIRFRFASTPDEFMDEHKNLKNRFMGLNRGNDRKNLPEVSHIFRDWGYPEPEEKDVDDIHTFCQTLPDNGNYSVAYRTIHISPNEKTLVIAITNDSEHGRAEEEAWRLLKEYSTDNALVMEWQEHIRWWHNFYPASFFTLNDTKLEALYWINIYKLGCLTRQDGMAMPMSGLWIPDNSLPPWGNTYIWNTQQEMPFYATYVGNRLDTQKTTYQLLIDHRDEMRHIGEDFFGIPGGEYLVHLTDYKLGCPNYTADHFQAVSGPWMMQMMWNYYLFSLDTEFMKEHVYPMMKAQCRTLMGILEMGDDGRLHFPWSMSAEYPPGGGHLASSMIRFGPDAVSDLSYTRWICETLLKAMNLLGIEDEEAPQWKYTLENLAEFTFDDFGALRVRADMPLSDSHRHLSHLFPITQTHQITPETEEGRKIIHNCIHALQAAGTGEWMGWTFPETGKIAQLIHDAPMAYELIREYADKFVLENTLDTNGSRDNRAFTYHVGFGLTIDSDGMFNEALQNFAVSSRNGTAYVFDCVPKELTDMSFYHFRSEGAFLLSGRRTNGKNIFLSVEPEAGGTFRLVSGFGTDITVRCDDQDVEYKVEGNSVVIETQPGKEYIITPKGITIGTELILPLKPRDYETNYFGTK